MCEPVSIGLMVAGIVTSVVGGVQKSNAQKAEGKATQDYYNYVAEQNKQQADHTKLVGEKNANLSQDKGKYELKDLRRGVMQFAATQIATGAANGVGSGSVTSADIAADTFDKAKLDELTIRYNADTKAQEAVDQANYSANDLENQSFLNKVSGKNSRAAGNAAATATMWNTVSNATSSAAKFK